MDGKDPLHYECVFKLPEKIADYCPIRTQWKVTPETMMEYCKICPYLEKYKVLIKHYAISMSKSKAPINIAALMQELYKL